MNMFGKQITNPFSSGSGGTNFEIHVQTYFVIMMLTGGFAPCLPPWQIKKIKLQGKHAGYNTDDFILFAQENKSNKEVKLLAQIKHTINITKSDKTFGEVIQSAWLDYSNRELFNRDRDSIALITGPLSSTDINNVRIILEWARNSEDASEFISKVMKSNFSNDTKRAKLNVFRAHIGKATSKSLSDEELWSFLKVFHLLGYDFDVQSGTIISQALSMIKQNSSADPKKIWLQVVEEVQYANQNAGTLSIETIPKEIISYFTVHEAFTIPKEFVKDIEKDTSTDSVIAQNTNEIAIAMMLGSWDETYENDKRAIEKVYTKSYNDFIEILRKIVLQPKTFITQKNRKWKIENRREALSKYGSIIFDEHLDKFKELAIKVLRVPDPKFDLPKEQHYMARVYGKVPLH